jgi:hypothetical protein
MFGIGKTVFLSTYRAMWTYYKFNRAPRDDDDDDDDDDNGVDDIDDDVRIRVRTYEKATYYLTSAP